MIVRVLSSGKDAAGLSRYLFGPGKANDHTNPHLVAGTAPLMAEWAGELTMAEATHLGRATEANWRRQYAPELALAGQGAGGVSRANLAEGEDAVAGQQHVFHATIALRPDEGPFTEEQWAEVASTYVEAMGFVRKGEYGPDETPDPLDATWYAAHHGLSREGNDHIHLVVCTTLRDGSSIDLGNSGRRSQQVRREVLEQLEYVTPLHDRDRPANTPTLRGYTAAEHNIARDRAANGTGSITPDRVLLQRIVRAAAAHADTEAAFINAVLSHPGVRLEAARWTPGSIDQVTGYKVAIGEGPVFTASKLAPDLTLSKLRTTWQETPETEEVARALWANDATKLDPLVATRDVPAQLDQAVAHLSDFADALERLDVADVDRWSEALASLSGTIAVVATGRLAAFSTEAGRAADVLARQALADRATRDDQGAGAHDTAGGTSAADVEDRVDRDQAALSTVPTSSSSTSRSAAPDVPSGLSGVEVATRHLQLALRAAGTDRHAGWVVVVQQLNRSVDAIARAREAHAAKTPRRRPSSVTPVVRSRVSRATWPSAPPPALPPAPRHHHAQPNRLSVTSASPSDCCACSVPRRATRRHRPPMPPTAAPGTAGTSGTRVVMR